MVEKSLSKKLFLYVKLMCRFCFNAVAKRSSMFDDPIVEIQELTALIKNDITALNMAISDLQTIQNIEIADGKFSEDRVVHSTTVCDDLKSKLMAATKELQQVLTARTQVFNLIEFNVCSFFWSLLML